MSRKRKGRCEYCGERARLHPYRIVFGAGDDPLNVVRLCDACLALAPNLRRDVLRIIAREREDKAFRGAMDHPAYAREGHGAMRQIRDG